MLGVFDCQRSHGASERKKHRDIAVTSIEDSLPMMEPDVVEDDLGLEQEMEPSRPPVRVRFEPIDGDLPFDFRV